MNLHDSLCCVGDTFDTNQIILSLIIKSLQVIQNMNMVQQYVKQI